MSIKSVEVGVEVLKRGALGQSGGVAVIDGLPDPSTCQALALEARDAYSESTRQHLLTSDGTEGRGGLPARALQTATGGPVQDALYASAWLHHYISQQCGATIQPSGNRGSYSFYVHPGDFLDLHLDVDRCDVTLITVLHDDIPPQDSSGGLVIYRGMVDVPLSHIRLHPDRGAELVKAQPGQSILILGGMIPHRVLPLGTAGQRAISVLCFRASPATGS
jgi:hypothetical protein